MKYLSRQCLVLLLGALAFGAQLQAQDFRVGFVNTDRIFREANTAKAAQAKLEQEFSRREKELNDLGNALKTASEKLRARGAHPGGSQRAPRQRQLVDQDREFQRKRREFQEDLNARKNEELQQVLERANRVVKQVAEQEKYDLILQEAVYINPKHDITDKVIKALNARAGDGARVKPWRLQLGAIVAALGGELHGDPTLPSTALAPLEVGRPAAPELSEQPALPAAAGRLAGRLCHRGAGAAGGRAGARRLHRRRRPLPVFRPRHPAVEARSTRARRARPCIPARWSTRRRWSAPSASHRPAVRGRARRPHRRRHGAQGPRDRRRGLRDRRALHPAPRRGDRRRRLRLRARTQARWEKIEQLGAVRIGDDVEIGANTCIDRGALDDTVIEDGVKLDNLIQIGHNVPHRPPHGHGRLRRRGRQRHDRRPLHHRRRRHRSWAT